MELLEAIKARHSVRSFTDEEVPDEVVMEALRMANLAPSAGNLQARDFVVVRDESTRRRLAEAALGQRPVAEAPVTVACCANLERIAHYGQRGRELYCVQDVAAAVVNMMLYLADQGYGTVWVGAFDEDRVAQALSLPAHVRPAALVPIGRPKGEAKASSRFKIEELVHRERW